MEDELIIEDTVVETFLDSNEETYGSKVGDLFYKLAQWCVVALAFLLPFWFLPTTVSSVFANKAFLVSFLTILSLLCYVVYIILHGRVAVPFHWLFIVVIFVVVGWIVSSLISSQTLSSLLGATGYEGTSTFSILVFFIFMTLIATLFPDRRNQLRLLTALGIGFLVLILSMIFFMMGWGKFFGSDYSSVTFNTIGSWRSVAFALGFFTMLLYPFLLAARGKSRVILSLIFVINLVAIAVVNFPLAWAVIGVFSILFLSYSIWQRSVSAVTLAVSFVLLLASLFGFFSQNALTSLLKLPAPIEVNVSYGATLDISKQVLKDHLLFGTGPASFMYSWDNLKPADINQTAFWNTRFGAGATFFLTLLPEIGIIVFLGFIFFLFALWYLGLRNLIFASEENQIFALTAFLLISYTLLMWAVYPGNYTLIVLGFFALGFCLATGRGSDIIRTLDIRLFREGPIGFISSLFLVFILIIGVLGMYLVGTRFIGQIVFSRGVYAFNTQGNIDIAEENINRAYGFDRWNSLYPRSLGQIALVRAQLFLKNNPNTKDLLGSPFKSTLDNSIKFHQEAINIGQVDFENYQALGKVYEFLVSIGVDGARAMAVAEYAKAIEYAPKNPVLFYDTASVIATDILRTHDSGLLKQAEDALTKAVALKPDYTAAHFLLAQVFDAEGNLPEATKRAEAAALLSPNDIGSLFQLGLLYYKTNRFTEAEQVLHAIININADYSNARYFLGLIYDRTNRRDAAIVEFEKIKALNPGNQEVETILTNLRSGRSALTSITSSPDKRNAPPIKQ